jgi:hypothetical protein
LNPTGLKVKIHRHLQAKIGIVLTLNIGEYITLTNLMNLKRDKSQFSKKHAKNINSSASDSK